MIAHAGILKIVLVAALGASGVWDGKTTQVARHAAPWVQEKNAIPQALGPYVSTQLNTAALGFLMLKIKPKGPKSRFAKYMLEGLAVTFTVYHTKAGFDNLYLARRQRNIFKQACLPQYHWNPPTGWACP
jgi:hypothetical protein